MFQFYLFTYSVVYSHWLQLFVVLLRHCDTKAGLHNGTVHKTYRPPQLHTDTYRRFIGVKWLNRLWTVFRLLVVLCHLSAVKRHHKAASRAAKIKAYTCVIQPQVTCSSHVIADKRLSCCQKHKIQLRSCQCLMGGWWQFRVYSLQFNSVPQVSVHSLI